MAHWKASAEFFPCSRAAWEDSKLDASVQNSTKMARANREAAQHDGVVRMHSPILEVYNHLLELNNGDSSEWGTGGKRREWWEQVCRGQRYVEWTSCGPTGGPGLWIGGLIGARGVA